MDDVKNAVDNIIVSHRFEDDLDNINGQLHKDTYFGFKRDEYGNAKTDSFYQRKLLKALSKSDIENIPDLKIRKLIKDALKDRDPKVYFKDEKNWPVNIVIDKDDGRKSKMVIKKVKVKSSAKPRSIHKKRKSNDMNILYALTKENHHLEIVEVDDNKGGKKWIGKIVSLIDAKRRFDEGESVIQTDHDEGEFVLFLQKGETVWMNFKNRGFDYYKVFSISINEKGTILIEFRHHRDARPSKSKNRPENYVERVTSVPNKLKEVEVEKVIIDPIGQVRRAND